VRTGPPPLAIGSVTFPTGEVGIGYPAVALTASGGAPPYTWSIGTGTLPPPLAVSGSSISGVPNSAGPFTFTVKATDSAGATAEVANSITIAPALSVAGRCDATACSVEQGCDAFCGGFGTQTGGVGPFQYGASGVLPTGTGLNGLSLSGVFSQPSGRAPFSFSVTVTDALGATGGVKAAFVVFQHLTLQGGTFTGNTSRIPFTVSLAFYSPAAGAPKVALGKGVLPKGTTLSVDPKAFQVVITVPVGTLPGSYLAVLVLTDGNPCSANSNCTTTANVTINIG